MTGQGKEAGRRREVGGEMKERKLYYIVNVERIF